MTKTVRSVLLASVILSLAPPAFAQSDPKKELVEAYSSLMRRPGMSKNQFRMIGDMFERLDANRDGISRDELDLSEAMSLAFLRSQLIGRMLHNDLDGDLVVTIDEYKKVKSSRQRRSAVLKDYPKSELDRINQQTTSEFRESDTNGDQVLSGPELYAGLKEIHDNRAEFGSGSSYELFRAMLNADPNKDDRITEAESLALLAEAGMELE